MSIEHNQLIAGHFYEITYPNSIYTVQAISSTQVRILTTNKERDSGGGTVTRASNIRPISKEYAQNPNIPDPADNESALFLLNKEL